MKKRFVNIGGETAGMSQADFLARIKSDAERYKPARSVAYQAPALGPVDNRL